MRLLNFNKNLCPILLFFAPVFTVLAVHVVPLSGYAEEKPQDTDARSPSENRKIHITADKLIADNKVDYAEFIGNVRATQEDTIITADRLKIFVKKNPGNKGASGVGTESINKIIASGNVKINFDNRVAVTRQAVYNTETGVLILSGDNSRIISGKDSISGEKITLYRTTGRIIVESGSEKRVEALLYSGEKGLK
ncbi:MAG: LptA/OstA family protein [Desulfobacterales bacterium]